jgi:glycosyltransferase involved in cell wall biosynthesis
MRRNFRQMKILTVTTLYPNAAAPEHGVFVENRLEAWRRQSGGEAQVAAPVPWFPFSHQAFGRYARYAAAPRAETRRGLSVRHPRYLLLPGLAMRAAPAALAGAFERAARAIRAEGYEFDLLDAHYLYPDGVAAVRVARRLGKPVVLTARGSDVTQLAAFARPRALILDAVRRADAVIAVAETLKDALVGLGAPAEKIAVLRNGVDLDRFRPLDRQAIRARLGLDGPVIASVGSLIERKGHDVVLKALGLLPAATLLIAGDGPLRGALERLALSLGLERRVRFLGAVAHADLAEVYNAADLLALASSREGWPNVLLEAMACGTPAVASDAGGCGEVIAAPAAGRIVKARTPEAFADAIGEALATVDRRATRAFAETRSWRDTAEGLSAIYAEAVRRRTPPVRFAPVRSDQGGRRLLFTVDTEEIFDWRRFDGVAHLSPPDDLDRLQRAAEAFGIRPLYFLTYPLIEDPATRAYFRRLRDAGRADLGVHLHQWNTPPLGGFAGDYYSWQCNLPTDAHRAKLAALVAAFDRAFGGRPIAHRAGRYGVAAHCYGDLAAAGLDFDFSPSAGFDFSAAGGPDFSAMSNRPFRAETPSGAVVVVPATGARALRGGRVFLRQNADPGLSPVRRGAAPIFSAPLRLSPEGAHAADLVALTKSLARDGIDLFVLSVHSTSMTAGANPYAADEAAIAATLARLAGYFEFFLKDFRGRAIGLGEFAERFGDVNLNPQLSPLP